MTVASVSRAFGLLRALDATDGTLSELARATDLPVATVSRLMDTLEVEGAVLRIDKAYRVGPTISELLDGAAAPYDLISLANSHLAKLADASQETAGLAEASDDHLLHLSQVATAHDVAVKDWTGVRVPMHSGCIGFVMMAHWSAADVAAYVERPLESFSSETVTDAKVIQKRLAQIRKTGFLWTTDEYAIGVTTIASPILDRDGAAVGAVHVHGPSFRFPRDADRAGIEEGLVQATASISAVLGWNEDEADD